MKYSSLIIASLLAVNTLALADEATEQKQATKDKFESSLKKNGYIEM